MNLWRRIAGRRERIPPDVALWRKDWARTAAEMPVRAEAVAELRRRLDRLSSADDLEVEREMLEGLDQALALHAAIEQLGLPVVETGHRVVGPDRCHFIAPASMPDDAAQPSGRLLLTSRRVIFAGGVRTITAPWHAVTRPNHDHRDLLLIRVDGSALYRFRCNSYGDAQCAAIIARHLVRR